MRKVLRRRLAAPAALAVAALAVALLFANVASALPDASGGGQAAAPPATAGAPHDAGTTGRAASTDPNICPSTSPQINAAGLDRQARQLASQRGSNSTGQIAPNSFCCPLPCPPPPPPPTCAPALHSGSQSAPQAGCGSPPVVPCTLTAREPHLWVNPAEGTDRRIISTGWINCIGGTPRSISLLVELDKQVGAGFALVKKVSDSIPDKAYFLLQVEWPA